MLEYPGSTRALPTSLGQPGNPGEPRWMAVNEIRECPGSVDEGEAMESFELRAGREEDSHLLRPLRGKPQYWSVLLEREIPGA